MTRIHCRWLHGRIPPAAMPGPKPRWSRRTWAGAGAVVFLLLGGVLAHQRVPGDHQGPPVAPDRTGQGPSPFEVLAALVRQLVEPGSPDSAQETPLVAWEAAEVPEEGQPIPGGQETAGPLPARPLEVVTCPPDREPPAGPESQIGPTVPAAPPVLVPDLPEPVPPKPFKRRRAKSEEDLRKELAWAPEVRSFTLDSMASLVRAYRADFQVSRGDWNGALEPVLLLQQRPDLANLPVRSGSACRLTPKAARTLQTLSEKLHAYVQRATAGTTPDGRPDAALLRETLRWEKRGQRPEWLRPEAIPVLRQLLMHEATPIRLLLVEILAEIEGRTATRALARRAVFDLSPEVRQAAVRALTDRPRSDHRPVFLEALRYPWAPAADHAAEALVALADQGAVPALVSLLKKPDPNGLFPRAGGRTLVQEVVRIDHRANCLMCHPPAIKGRDPVPGMVPGVSMQLPESNFRMLAMCRETGRVVVNPLLVRADVTFLRQDFSVRQPTVAPGVVPAEDLRFDYLVRTRPARSQELARLKSRPDDPNGYEQRGAVLFTLRELTGLDPGPTTVAWQHLSPRAELDAEAERLADALVRTPVNQVGRVLNAYQEGKGPAYTQALALAIPRLPAGMQDRARKVLAERLARLPDALTEGLRDDDLEIRRAAAEACALQNNRGHLADLIGLLEDPEPSVAEAAHAALLALTRQDLGPAAAWND